MFVSTPLIPNIESLSQSTTSSLDSRSFGINRANLNIQQQTTSEVANIEPVMADNEDLDPPSPQDIKSLFVAAKLSSCSSSDSAKYKRACFNAKVICYFILLAGECPGACSKALPIALNHKENASIMAVTGASFQKKANAVA